MTPVERTSSSKLHLLPAAAHVNVSQHAGSQARLRAHVGSPRDRADVALPRAWRGSGCRPCRTL